MFKNDIDKLYDEILIDLKNYLIGYAIAEIRKKKCVSLKTVASCLQISVKELQLYEEGIEEVNAEILFKLSKLFNVSVADFFIYCDEL